METPPDWYYLALDVIGGDTWVIKSDSNFLAIKRTLELCNAGADDHLGTKSFLRVSRGQITHGIDLMLTRHVLLYTARACLANISHVKTQINSILRYHRREPSTIQLRMHPLALSAFYQARLLDILILSFPCMRIPTRPEAKFL